MCVILAASASVLYTKKHKITYQAAASVIANPTASSTSSQSPAAPSGPDPLVQTHDPSIELAAAKAAGTTDGSVGLSFGLETSNPTLLDVTAIADTPGQAAAAANAAANAYIAVRGKALATSAASLDGQLGVIAGQIHALQAQGAVSPGSVPGTQTSGANLAADEQLAVAIADYQSLFQQQQTLSLDASGVQVYSAATPGGATATASSHKVIELAVVAGLLAGLGIALLRHRLDDRLRTASEIEMLSSHSLLSRIPLRSDSNAAGTIATNPNDELTESVRELRTALRFVAVEREVKTILVTSSVPGEGKSFVAANLAAAWAMSGMLTVLVSSDLRAPTAERLLGIAPSDRGISTMVADATARLATSRSAEASAKRRALPVSSQLDLHALGQLGISAGAEPTSNLRLQGSANGHTTNGHTANGHPENGQATVTAGESSASRPVRSSTSFHSPTDLLDLLVWSGVKDLWLCPAGPVPPNPAELLGSSAFEDLAASIAAIADVVILDSPPVLTVTDAMVLTEQADGVVFVVAEGRTSRSAAQRAIQLLESSPTPILGVVANMASRNDVSAYYGTAYDPYRRQSRSSHPDPGGSHVSGRGVKARR
jgi:Mrp family chromosome partitioning ATPase